MEKENKKSVKKDWIIVLSILGIIFIFILASQIDWNKSNKGLFSELNNQLSLGLSEEMKTKLDAYDDQSFKCQTELSSLAYSNNLTKYKNKLILCEGVINQAKTQINSWSRDQQSKELEVAKLDYDSTSDEFRAVSILIQIYEGDYTSKLNALNKLKNCQELLNKISLDTNKIETTYNNTEYYQRYWLPKSSEIQENKEAVLELNEGIQELIDEYESISCPLGYVLSDDFECFPQCGASNEYCETGECCNGRCYSCNGGYSLNSKCICVFD